MVGVHVDHITMSSDKDVCDKSLSNSKGISSCTLVFFRLELRVRYARD